MIDVINLQRKSKIDTKALRVFVRCLPSKIEEANGKSFSVAFVSDERMRTLNSTFRGKDSTTDVLSFSFEPDNFEQSSTSYAGSEAADARADRESFLGDIVISAEQAARQAKENNLTLEKEIKQLILHGLLHLCGFDHETDRGEMNARELELRERLQVSDS